MRIPERSFVLIAFAFVVSAGFGISTGAPTARAAESCGEPDAEVCSYIPSGCGQGQACNQHWCMSILCGQMSGGPGTRCWRCGSGGGD